MFSICIFIINLFTLLILNSIYGLNTQDYTTLLVIIVIVIQGLGIFLDMHTRDRVFKNYGGQLLIAYALRIALIIIDLYYKEYISLPNSGADSVVYYDNAVYFATTGQILRNTLFARIMGYIFMGVGTNQLLGQYIISFFSMIAIYFFARILLLFDIDKEYGSRLMYMMAILPNFAIQSSLFLREIPIAMFTSISVYCFLYWMKKNNYITLILSFVFIMLGSALHAGVASLCGGYVLTLFLYSTKYKKYVFNVPGLIFSIIFTVAFLFLFSNYSDTFFSKINGIDSIEDISDNMERGSSSYAKYVGSSKTPANFVIFTIPRMLYFIFSPFPWQWRNATDAFSFAFSSMYYMMAYVFIFKAIKEYKGEAKYIAISLLLISLCALFVFGWGINNTGTALRHRDKLVVLYGAMYINYFSCYKPKTKKIKKKHL